MSKRISKILDKNNKTKIATLIISYNLEFTEILKLELNYQGLKLKVKILFWLIAWQMTILKCFPAKHSQRTLGV